jgi:hypothetical protein
MAETKERRKTPRKSLTPKPDSHVEAPSESNGQAAAPRKPTSEQRAAPMETNLRSGYSSEEMRKQIEEAAYYRAKQRGFEPGHELEDWIQAESEVMRRNGLR